jgi:hypothetical protein
LLIAPPAPVVPIGTEPVNSGPSAAEQFFAPATMQTTFQLPPAEQPYSYKPGGAGPSSDMGKWFVLAGMVLFVIAAVATAVFAIKPGASAKHQTPTALAPRAPTAGLPTSLSVIVRVEAESTRHTALQTIEAAGNADLTTLASAQPDYLWVAGDTASSGPKIVSVRDSGGVVTIAVAGSNHDVCAFGQWSVGVTPLYVTMEHQDTCAANQAPVTGWSTQAGGAGSDLPDDSG